MMAVRLHMTCSILNSQSDSYGSKQRGRVCNPYILLFFGKGTLFEYENRHFPVRSAEGRVIFSQ
jgi:hypothetical protein